MDLPDRLRYLLQRYAENSCTQQEMDEFLDYIKDPAMEILVKETMDEMWEGRHIGRKLIVDGILPQASQKVSAPPAHHADRRSIYMAWGIAASFFIFLVAGLAWFFQPRQKAASITNAAIPVMSKSTQEEHRLITLPDGSSVWLNSNSELAYASSFSGANREVMLKGEAFFDIKEDALRPFIIHTGKIKTTVLGTAFNVRALPSEASVTVTVTRGKVRVEDDQNTRVIIANQQVSLSLNEQKPTQQTVKVDQVASWIREDLIMDNITFAEAAAIIEDRYKVVVEFRNKRLEGCRFTSTFLKDANLEQMLTAICIVNRATFNISGRNVTVIGEGCDPVIHLPE
jgi:transmembrane sensor